MLCVRFATCSTISASVWRNGIGNHDAELAQHATYQIDRGRALRFELFADAV